ncbi:MAG: hypothetical protein SGI74_05920 [Oligoflexia bacterium]|nr:hypothetical protein [Oligoflexia bacterium]
MNKELLKLIGVGLMVLGVGIKAPAQLATPNAQIDADKLADTAKLTGAINAFTISKIESTKCYSKDSKKVFGAINTALSVVKAKRSKIKSQESSAALQAQLTKVELEELSWASYKLDSASAWVRRSIITKFSSEKVGGEYRITQIGDTLLTQPITETKVGTFAYEFNKYIARAETLEKITKTLRAKFDSEKNKQGDLYVKIGAALTIAEERLKTVGDYKKSLDVKSCNASIAKAPVTAPVAAPVDKSKPANPAAPGRQS